MEHAVYIGNNQLFVKTAWGAMLYAYADDLSLTPSLLVHGFFESGLTNFLIHTIKPGQRVMDIGANIGYFSVLLAHLLQGRGKLVSYEPDPRLYELLCRNLSVQNLDPVSETHRKAAYSGYAQLTFHKTAHFLGNGSLVRHSDMYKNRFRVEQFQTIQVDAVPLDCHYDDEQAFDFVKIDVEGAELRVFQGMKKLFEGRKVGIVAFELNRAMMPEPDWNAFYELLSGFRSAYGAEFFGCAPDGTLVPVTLESAFGVDYIAEVVMKLKR